MDAAKRLELDVKTPEGAQPTYDALDAGHIRVYRHQKANASHFEAGSINEQSKNILSKALNDSSFPEGHSVQLEFHKPKYTLKDFDSPEQAKEWLENLGARTEPKPSAAKGGLQTRDALAQHIVESSPANAGITLDSAKRMLAADKYELKEIPVDSVKRSVSLPNETSRQYTNRKTPIPAVVLDSESNVIDGHHRITAAKMRGEKTISAYVPATGATTETVYHGSPDVSKIDSLKPGNAGGYFGDGIYLSRDPKVAQRFTKLESANPTLERNADGSFTDINTGKRVPGGKPGVVEVTLKDARLKSMTIEAMEAEVEKFRQPNGTINLDAARRAVAEKYAEQGYNGFDVPASKNFNEPQVLIFPSSAEKLKVTGPTERTAAKGLPAPVHLSPSERFRQRQLNLKGLGIGLTEMAPEDAKNWVGYTNQESLKIYRGVDDPSHKVEAGDFVTTSKESARNYGKHVQEIEVSPSELRYVRGHKDGNPRLLDQGGQTELIYAPKARRSILTLEGAQPLADNLGATVVGSVAKKGSTPKDLDLRIEGKTSSKEIRSKMQAQGFEFQGSTVLSPAEAEQSGKKFAPGWNNVEHFTNNSGQKIDVWHSE